MPRPSPAAGPTSGRRSTRSIRTAPMPSQSAIRARTPGRRRGSRAAPRRSPGPRGRPADAGAAAGAPTPRSRVATPPRRAPRLGGDARGDRRGQVRGRRPGDVVAQGRQALLEVGHRVTASPAPARSNSARMRSSARDRRDFTVPAGSPGPPPSHARRGRGDGGRRSPPGRARPGPTARRAARGARHPR